MAGSWQTVPLAELIKPEKGISYGIVQPGAHEADGIPIVRVTDVRNGRIAVHSPLRVAPAIEKAYARTRLTGGELLLTIVGTVGECAVVPKSLAGWNTARAIAVLPIAEEFGAYWVQLALRAPVAQEIIKSRLNTTVQATLNLRDVAKLPILLPPPDERRAIAHILGTLDDKIELNRRMNETLEEMARALFKSWFVDFDPVRSKAEGRDPGLPKHLADLFPSRFVDSELGGIPEGWRHARVQEVCEAVFDGPHATPPESECGPVFLGIRNFTPTSLDLSDVRHISEDDFPRWTKRVVPNAGDIVFTYEATLGFFAIIPPGVRCCLGRRTALVRVRRDGFNPHFLFGWFVASPFQEFLRAHRQTGSTVDRILLRDFPGYPVLCPPPELVARFGDLVAPFTAQAHSRRAESSSLGDLRDALLPKLISGELRVRDAQRIVEAAT